MSDLLTNTRSTEIPSALTLEKLLAVMDSYPRPPPDPFAMSLFSRPGTFAGMDVIEMPPPPAKVRISDSFPWVSDKFRAEMNAWLVDQFGYHPAQQPMILSGRYLAISKPDLSRLIACIT